MYYNDQYDYWVDYDYDEEPLVPRMKHESVADAVFTLMEELYDSAKAIQPETIRQTFAYLCDQLNLKDDLLHDENGLCVIHQKEKQPDTASKVRRDLAEHAVVLKEELTSEEPMNKERVENALKKICWEVGTPMFYGQKINVQRSKSELFDFAVNLARSQAMGV